MTRILLDVEFVVETCCRKKCGITWAVPSDFHRHRRDDHELFYCPNGHSQHYPQKSQEEILKERLNYCRISRNNIRDERNWYKRSQASLKGQITKMRKAMSGDKNDGNQKR